MAGETKPSDYYPNQGSFAKRWMKTRDQSRNANEGSRTFEATPDDEGER